MCCIAITSMPNHRQFWWIFQNGWEGHFWSQWICLLPCKAPRIKRRSTSNKNVFSLLFWGHSSLFSFIMAVDLSSKDFAHYCLWRLWVFHLEDCQLSHWRRDRRNLTIFDSLISNFNFLKSYSWHDWYLIVSKCILFTEISFLWRLMHVVVMNRAID